MSTSYRRHSRKVATCADDWQQSTDQVCPQVEAIFAPFERAVVGPTIQLHQYFVGHTHHVENPILDTAPLRLSGSAQAGSERASG